MRAVLKKELNQTIAEPESAKALLSGSDVFFTGREFFIGLSNHTNTDGAMAVATTWPEYPCTPIKVSSYSISTYGIDSLFQSKSLMKERTLKKNEKQSKLPILD